MKMDTRIYFLENNKDKYNNIIEHIHRFVNIYVVLYVSSVLLGFRYIFFNFPSIRRSSQLDMTEVSGKVSMIAFFGKLEKVYIEILKVQY